MTAREELSPEERATLAEQLGSALPARNSLLLSLGDSIRERRGMGPVLRRLLDAEAEVARLRDELAEVRAGRDPRLRSLLIKAAKDEDTYVGWSTNSEAPTGVWSRETALEYGFPASRLDRADVNGSSSTGPRFGYWDHEALIAEQRGLLPRARLADYAIEYLYGDRIAAYALLEPLEGETEVRR